MKHPSDLTNYQDRYTLIARAGEARALLSQPDTGTPPVSPWPEIDGRRVGAPFNREEAGVEKKRQWWHRR